MIQYKRLLILILSAAVLSTLSTPDVITLGNISYIHVESHHNIVCDFDTVHFTLVGQKWELGVMYCHDK